MTHFLKITRAALLGLAILPGAALANPPGMGPSLLSPSQPGNGLSIPPMGPPPHSGIDPVGSAAHGWGPTPVAQPPATAESQHCVGLSFLHLIGTPMATAQAAHPRLLIRSFPNGPTHRTYNYLIHRLNITSFGDGIIRMIDCG